MIEPRGGNYIIPGLKRGLDVLKSFTRETPELGAPDLVKRLGMSRSTVYRVLQTLEGEGCIERTQNGHKYRLSVALLRIGFEFLASQSVVEFGRPVVDMLSLDTGLSSHLVIRDRDQVVYVLSSKPPTALIGAVTVGTRLPAHATVYGRILLGEQSLGDLEQIFGSDPLASSSAQTPILLTDLYQLVDADRSRGFGFSEGFYEPNVSTVAAPVRNYDGHITAAVGVTVNASHLSLELIQQGVVEKTVAAAERVASYVGYQGSLYSQAKDNARTLQNNWLRETSA